MSPSRLDPEAGFFSVILFCMSKSRYDKLFLLSVVLLVVFGLFIFTSASMGLLAREGASFGKVVQSQILFGLGGGIVAFLRTAKIPYSFWRRHALTIFVSTLILSALVFIPKLGFSHGGANRWINLGFTTFQPSELLKIGFIIYFAAWLSSKKNNVQKFSQSVVPFLALLGLCALILLPQPDVDVLVLLFCVGVAMLLGAGVLWRHILILFLIAGALLGLVAIANPHVIDRVLTFMHPARDPLGSGYQVKQVMIAIGSGGFFGRGFGQSVQKFDYLPEPVNDSIFAVAAEEFGFVGSSILILLFLFLAFRGLRIASRAPDNFSRLLALGIVILIVAQSYGNISAMLSIIPLIGTPLLFVSQGGSALLVTLAEVGIVLNISKRSRKD